MTQSVVVFGTITSDGKLELDGPVLLPPGPVLVTLEPLVETESPGAAGSQPEESPAGDKRPSYE